MRNWIKRAIKHPGALHKALGIKQGGEIPASKMIQAQNSTAPRIKRMANLATTLKSFHK